MPASSASTIWRCARGAGADAMIDEPRAAPDGAHWPAHWNALDQPWRTELEVSVERQTWLAERRAGGMAAAAGEYPFAGVQLSRADVEWLLATHDDGRG